MVSPHSNRRDSIWFEQNFWNSGTVKVKVTLQQTVSQPVSFGVKPYLGPQDQTVHVGILHSQLSRDWFIVDTYYSQFYV
jgi:hypothetical protein